jgi:hypothetical protein
MNSSKVAIHEIYRQNQLFFPYTKDKQSKKETTKIIIFTKASKRIKYLGILLTKKVKLSY